MIARQLYWPRRVPGQARRAGADQALAQRLYDDYRGVMLGMRSLTWAVSKKVNNWPTLVYVPLENNYEYVS